MSSQDSLQGPPLKKQRQNPQSSQVSLEEQFQLSQSFKTSSAPTSQHKTLIIKKGDKIQKRVSQLLTSTVENGEAVLLMSAGDSVQKLSSIIEILKMRLREVPNIKFEQLNKLDFYETAIKKNEILDKMMKVPVLYIMVRPQRADIVGFEEWTRQEI